jgi:hypothetical protein
MDGGGGTIPYRMEDAFICQEYEAKLKSIDVNKRMDPNRYPPPEQK